MNPIQFEHEYTKMFVDMYQIYIGIVLVLIPRLQVYNISIKLAANFSALLRNTCILRLVQMLPTTRHCEILLAMYVSKIVPHRFKIKCCRSVGVLNCQYGIYMKNN